MEEVGGGPQEERDVLRACTVFISNSSFSPAKKIRTAADDITALKSH